MRRTIGHNIVISIFALMIIASSLSMMTASDYFNLTHFAYGQPDKMNPNNTNSLNVQNIPAKKFTLEIRYCIQGFWQR